MEKHPIIFGVVVFTLGGLAGAGMMHLQNSGKLFKSTKAPEAAKK